MYKNTYDREAYLYIDERLREEAHRQLVREATAGQKPAHTSLLVALGRLFTRTGATQPQQRQPAADRGSEALSIS